MSFGSHPLEYTPYPVTSPAGAPAGDFQHIQTSPDMFGASIGRGLSTLGQGVEKAGLEEINAAAEQQQKRDEVHVAEVDTWLADRVTERHAKFATLEGAAAMHELPQYKKDLTDLYQQAMGQVSSDFEKATLARTGMYLTSRFFGYGTQHAAGQERAWADKSANDRATSSANVAAIANQNGDTQGMDIALNSSDEEVRKRFAQKGYDSEVIAAEVSKNRGGNLKRIIQETAAYNPDAAVSMFNRYMPQMDAGSRVATATFLLPIRKQQAAREVGDQAFGQAALPAQLNDEIDKAASIAGIEPGLLRGVVRIESSGDPRAVKGSYKGLGQLSDELFQKYGGGDIFSARDNLRATARKIADEAGDFEQKYGRLPTAAEMYLTHQQGAGGLAAHMASPDRPAWQNMLSTREGQQKGEAWAKAAIWGNIPDRDKAQFGSVEGVTSRQFMQLWGRKVDAATGQLLPDKAEAYSRAREILRTRADGQQIEAETMSYIGRRYAHHEAEFALETQRMEGQVKSDVTSMLNSGRGVEDIDPVRIRGVLGAAAAQRWMEERSDAQATWSATHDMPTLTDRQIDERLREIAPKPGSPDYDRQQAIFEKASDSATKLRKQRDLDPAETVRSDPLVKAAEAAPAGPGAIQSVIDARLASQTRAGIPKENQSPITQAEAITLTKPLRTMLPGQDRDVLTAMATKFQELYGDHADQAFAYALRVHKVDNEVAQMAARLVKKLGLGQLPDVEDVRAVGDAVEIGAAQRAVSAPMTSGERLAQSVPGYGMGPSQQDMAAGTAARRAGVNIPARAVVDLRLNPKLAVDFDKKYGAGSAAKILESYPVR